MARRNNRRFKQPKLKNNQILQLKKSFTATGGDFVTYLDLIQNPTNTNGTNLMTGYVETIGRFSIDCTLEGTGSLDNVAMFVMYIPEGYDVTASQGNGNVLNQHPEWIMAYKYLGSPTQSFGDNAGQGCQPTRIRSGVRRNLMTGDRIVLVITGTNSASQSTTGILWAYLKFASRIN